MFQQLALPQSTTTTTPAHMSRAQLSHRAGTLFLLAHDTKHGFFVSVRYFLISLGLMTIVLAALIFAKPALFAKLYTLYGTPQLQISNPFSSPTTPALTMMVGSEAYMESDDPKYSAPLAGTREQQRVTNWLAKRYHVAAEAANMLVSSSYDTAREVKLDPLLILSVMAIESGLNPFAESPVGAQGLMQVMSKIHHEKFEELGGLKAALNPTANIKVGALILKDYVTRGGSVEAGLKIYVGAADFENDSGYGSRVLTEYRRLKDVAGGKSVPTFFAAPAAVPTITTIRKIDAIETQSAPAELKEVALEQVASLQ